MKMMMRVALLIALAWSGAASAAAQTAPQAAPIALTLEAAIERGVEGSHRIAEAEARVRGATALVAVRHAVTLPQIAVLGGYQRTNHVDEFGVLLPTGQLRILYPDVPDNYRARLDVQWPVYNGGRAEAAERAATADAAAATAEVTAVRSDVRLEITRAYWVFVTAGESLRVLDESRGRIDAHLRDMKNRLDAGLVAPNEVLTVEAQASRHRMLAIQARSAREVAEADLARLSGLAPGARIEPVTPLANPTAAAAAIAALVDRARRGRADRQALEQRAAGAEQRVAAARGGLRPVIALAGGVDYARPNPRIFPREGTWRESWDIGVSVSWPLFDGGRTRAEIAEASAASSAIAARLAEFDALLELEVRQRTSEIESAGAAISAADDALRAALEARRVVSDRFGAGVATSTDVLDAQVAVLQADLDRTQALATAQLAAARLARSLGGTP